MAILENQIATSSLSSSKTSSSKNLSSCPSNKNNFNSIDSSSGGRSNRLNNIKDLKSPYLTSDKIHMLSRVTEKKLTHKKAKEMFSSFPLAVNLYRSNSDELKRSIQGNTKFKKSVLTLPNKPAPIPKIYTVSDLNDSECFNDVNDGKPTKTKKRRAIKRNKKPRMRDRVMEYYDRDARYCSQLNIDLDCSSSEIINYNGDGKRISKRSNKSYNPVKAKNHPHDVWAVLRNINKLQFRPSPPESQESVVPLRKRQFLIGNGTNRNDTRIIETCHTEEFAYISSFEIDSKSRDSCSPSSSFDRVTVIDKKSEQDEIKQQFRRNVFEANTNIRGKGNTKKQIQERNKPRLKNNKVSQCTKKIEDSQIVTTKMHNNIIQLENNDINNFCDNFNYKQETIVNKASNIIINSENCNSLVNNSASNNKTNNFNKVDRSGDNNKSYKIKNLIKTPNARNNVTKLGGDLDKQFTGITKVILSKEQVSSILSESPRKQRLALTLPNTNISNLTQIEIKRRLANLKFPIVILGKDQITNHPVHVVNYEPPQFNGLDQHIWPFMLKWSEENSSQIIQERDKKEIVKIKQKYPRVKHNVTNDQKDLINNDSKSDEHKTNAKSCLAKTPQHLVNDIPSQMIRKPKPISTLKNKMFQLLQKSSTPKKVSNIKFNNNAELKTIQDKIVGTSESINNEINQKSYIIPIRVNPDEVKKMPVDNSLKNSYSTIRYPWAKAKRASDFIENIIKKIKSGMYYSVDRREIKWRINKTEVSTQTETSISRNACCQNSIDNEIELKLFNKKDDPLTNLSAFDKTLSKLKIETISAKQITVKHCITNVVVQFDIQMLTEANNIMHTKKTTSFMPLYVKDKQQKIFKYNSSIHNAILPAELCSIIPTMMRSILEADKKCFPSKAVEKVESNLTVISELTGCENPELTIHSVLSGLVVSHQIQPMLNGQFPPAHPGPQAAGRMNLCLRVDRMDHTDTLYPRVNPQILLQFHKYFSLLKNSLCNNFVEIKSLKVNHGSKFVSNCMALQPYEPRNLSIVPSFGIFNSAKFLKQIIDKYKINELSCPILNVSLYGHIRDSAQIITSGLSVILPILGSENNSTMSPKYRIGIISLFNVRKSSHNCEIADARFNSMAQTDIEEKEASFTTKKKERKLRQKGQRINIFRKNSYIKFYRKCKSMSSISNYKSTPLNGITSLDEFCQILGSNSFSKVLDGCPEKKILAAVTEMKNWITEITPKQALLVLLLTNKKDTPNLIRFRPVLLQGIAVNRITRAVELDTEIEVIERENINKLSQFEGISYLPASAENQDNLFEELYWIAKTTASDYQKKFDETSEKLLKSLLEKRKKLNPSYLRVMARYVGLGLLTRLK